MGRDFYKILGVSKNADAKTIRKAYKKGAVKWHPDRNPNNREEAQKKFKDISDAYEVLSNPEKKEIYDKHGEEGLKKGGVGMGDPTSLFEHFFGGFGGDPFGRGRRRQQGPKRGDDIGFQLGVELEDLYKGKVKKLKVNKNIICTKCSGEGTKKKGATTKCSDCDGRGMKIEVRNLGPGFVSQTQTVCSSCRGKGQVIPEKDKCPSCKGKKIVSAPNILEVDIIKGMKDGERITFHGEADQYPGTIAGDVVIIIQEKNTKHPHFIRKGNDLIFKKKITLSEALTGFKFALTHLDGRVLVISSQEGEVVKPGDLKVISNEGMPIYKRPTEKGRLILQFDVEFPSPDKLSDESRKTLKQILPEPEPFELPTPTDQKQVVENYVAHDYVETREEKSRNREAYDSDDEGEARHTGSTQCTHM